MIMKKSFDEIVLFARTGLNPRTNFKLGKGTNKYITIKNIHNNTILIDENTDVIDDDAIKLIHKRSQIKKGDILFCSIGRMGDMYIIPEEPVGWDINESVFAFTLNTDIIRQKYFYYIFKNHNTIEFLSKNSSGSTFKSIKMNQLKRMFFDVPTLNEQDKIISVLDNVCKTIELRKQQLQQLDELVKARFVELFGHQSCNEKNMPYGKIDDVAEIYLGLTHTPTYVSEGVKFISAKNTSCDYLDLSDVKYISREEFKNAPNGAKPQKGDMLFSRVGSNLGHPVILDIDDELCTFVSLGFLRAKGKVTNLYLKHWMRDDFFAEQVRQKVTGGGQPNLNTGWLKEFKIIIPPIELQNEFANFVKQIDKSKFVVQRALDEAQTLFDSLMQEYFG